MRFKGSEFSTNYFLLDFSADYLEDSWNRLKYRNSMSVLNSRKLLTEDGPISVQSEQSNARDVYTRYIPRTSISQPCVSLSI